uniref:Uncharacterized protein n=1 Tax=Candidatus Kentrum sp. FM TaxID=2126340 RepID=A0A450TYP3_9GAMM|nr:MAG: hypothetical protein BECKFM1743A_GA0114220_107333 [Candidatus Kentron sp. FM]VFJ74946.1 MAG: hypothetical protein BECKFM1743C_GA0114222_108173 [Candidatus Kentron sp. FM]VFK21912.1 MAG: hypothetical protein BECKFM1743B_GA0114221_108253 [Candidatus Kentron sp. FM]
MVDGEIEFFQEALGGLQALDVGEPLLEIGEDGGVEVEGLRVPACFSTKRAVSSVMA